MEMEYEEIKQLLQKYLEDQCSYEEQMKVNRLLMDPGYELLVRRFMEENEVSSTEIPLLDQAHSESLYSVIEDRIQKEDERISVFRRVAASLLILFVFSLLLISDHRWLFSEQSMITVINTDQAPKKIELPDGSHVLLNRHSEITFPQNFSSVTRFVSLKGEAFFTVAKNRKKPFIVDSEYFSTRVLGTSFNVRSYSGKPSIVTVATGKVSVHVPGHSLDTLTRGQRLVLGDGRVSIAKDIDPRGELLWTGPRLLLTGKNLEEVAIEISKVYNIPFRLENEDLKECVIHGEVALGDLFETLKAISFAYEFQWEMVNNEIILTGGGCQ